MGVRINSVTTSGADTTVRATYVDEKDPPKEQVAPPAQRWIQLDEEELRLLRYLSPAERVAFKVRGKTNLEAARSMLQVCRERDASRRAVVAAAEGL